MARVSLIHPNYNNAGFIVECFGFVLSQTHPFYGIIVAAGSSSVGPGSFNFFVSIRNTPVKLCLGGRQSALFIEFRYKFYMAFAVIDVDYCKAI